MGFIYKITSPSKKMYVGQTKNKPQKRWNEHCKQSSGCVALKNAITKYGLENMTFEVVEECADELLNDREHHWIRDLNTLSPHGYNLRTGGGANELSEESVAKLTASRRHTEVRRKGYIGNISEVPSRRIGGQSSFKLKGTRGQLLGLYQSYKDAEAAAVEYTRAPENFVPKRSDRAHGTGGVYRTSDTRWEAYIDKNKERKHLGYYDTKKEAENACDRYLEDPDGFVKPPLLIRKAGTGSVRKSQNGKRWMANYGGKYLGTFDTEAQAEAAILAHKEKILRAEGKKPLKE